ncbi:MAG: cytochrome b/b6 domain-containing protein [candidate division Zixibacteria bacterium]|nr:cytochrome b/b6 domain-containing protein [candidate division Zixibacteria bacterium]
MHEPTLLQFRGSSFDGRSTGVLLRCQSAGLTAVLLLAAILLAFGGPVLAQEEDPGNSENCLMCHEGAVIESEPSVMEAHNGSTHEGMACIDCHSGITELPHAEELPRVACGDCHDDAAGEYHRHGRLTFPGGEDIPDCADCHGKHDILPSSNKQSRVNPMNLPATCGSCHEDIDLTEKHEILFGRAVDLYKSSVHGTASLGGVYFAATCNDCHSTGGTAHRIYSPDHPESSINHFNIPSTCGRCHHNVEMDFWEGIHGKLVKRGETDAPVCTDCHGEHGIISPDNPESRVSPTRVAEATCAPCHESARLNEKYGTPVGRVQSWVDSYHGLKSRAGDLTVANCASCHGAHRILPHTDSTSSIHPSNLKETCGQCHAGITEQMAAATQIHGQPGVSQTNLANIIKSIYIVIIVVVIGVMIVHWLIDLLKQIRGLNKLPQIRRMTPNEVWQHTFLMVTFIVLVISGFSLRFYEAWWSQWLFGWEGGADLRGIIHRVAAVLFMLTTIWHVIYLTGHRGRQFVRDMLPTWKDITQFVHMVTYNLGFRKDHPDFGRFSYVEKAEYWALVWGTIVMALTGIALWFDNLVVMLFPKGALDVMLVIHYYEAWLATLAILVWHMYSTVFNPKVYPMNPSWYTGKMPIDMLRSEHPEDPSLLALDGRSHGETRHPVMESPSGSGAAGDDPGTDNVK